jgi:hypothetical protein
MVQENLKWDYTAEKEIRSQENSAWDYVTQKEIMMQENSKWDNKSGDKVPGNSQWDYTTNEIKFQATQNEIRQQRRFEAKQRNSETDQNLNICECVGIKQN